MNWTQIYKQRNHQTLWSVDMPKDCYLHCYNETEWSFDVELRDDITHNFCAADLRAIADKLDELNKGKVLEP